MKHGGKATSGGPWEPSRYSQRQNPWSEQSQGLRVWYPELMGGDLVSPVLLCPKTASLRGAMGQRDAPGRAHPSPAGAEVMGRSEELLKAAPAKSNR